MAVGEDTVLTFYGIEESGKFITREFVFACEERGVDTHMGELGKKFLFGQELRSSNLGKARAKSEEE